MLHRVAQFWKHQPWLLALLLCALVTRLLIPVGFMPARGGLVICQGFAPAVQLAHQAASAEARSALDALLGDSGGDSGSSGDSSAAKICSFALLGSAAAVHKPFVAAFRVDFSPTRVALAPAPALPRKTVASNRLPRGPPTSI